GPSAPRCPRRPRRRRGALRDREAGRGPRAPVCYRSSRVIRRSVQYRPMLAYEKAGSGPPLLLIHGLGSCKEVWKPVVPLLAREREVVTLDLPGFGASPSGARTVDGLADAVLQ